ncbi:MAG: hypothetical protein LBI66_06450 [Burkholderiaceae bacterium]|jgi:hypothetical protein|nr:hypothetical protein [Burkholderiaceae bacterium]
MANSCNCTQRPLAPHIGFPNFVQQFRKLALQATICIEQCAQTKHRGVSLCCIRSGSDQGEPLAHRAKHYTSRSLHRTCIALLKSSGCWLFRVASRLIDTVYQTAYGPFDGNSWERLCQLVFKRKFTVDGYLHIPATPGDYGLEGFTKTTGCGYQCYCPEKAYSTRELYEKQRNKITSDLNKLQSNQADLLKILGSTKLRRWHLVTPTIAHNDLIKHAQTKEGEVRGWNLSILDADFQILVHDADHYATEIQEIQQAVGRALDFGGLPAVLPVLTDSAEVYEKNVMRKTRARLAHVSADKLEAKVNRLYASTLREFLDHGLHLKRINDTAPTVHSRLARLINGYEADIGETCVTWEGTPQELTEKIRVGLTERIVKDLAPAIDETGASQIARLIVARWIAVCEVDYD